MKKIKKKLSNSNYRNGYSKKTLKSTYGEIDTPRNKNLTFEPKLVKKTKTFKWTKRFVTVTCKRNQCKEYSTLS